MKTPQGAAQVGWWRPTSFCCALLLAAGCNLDNPGIAPPVGKIAYPVALALSEDNEFLYVVNSNFDLRYNAGSVHSYNLDELEEEIGSEGDPEGCFVLSTRGASDAGVPDANLVTDHTMYPDASDTNDADAGSDGDAGLADAGLADAGLADAGDAGDIGNADAGLADAGDDLDAGMDSGIALGPILLPPSRDYSSQRGILCDEPGAYDDSSDSSRCCIKSRHEDIFVGQVLTDSYASAVALAPDGKTLYVTVRSGNRLLYLDAQADGKLTCGGDEGDCTRGPDPKNTQSKSDAERLPPTPNAMVAGRLGDLGIEGRDADANFVATVHEQGELSLFVDRGDGRGPILEDVLTGGARRATSVSVSGVDPQNPTASQLLYVTSSLSSAISRVGVVPRGAGNRLLFATSDLVLRDLTSPTDLRAVLASPDDPNDLFVLIRGTLQSLAFLRIDTTASSEARTIDGLGLGAGPSKLVLGTVDSQKLLFASSFNAGSVFVVNPQTRRTVAVITGFSGPFDMVVDEGRKLMYVADFRASVVRVVSLSGLTDRSRPPPRIVATLGELTFPERIR